VVIEAVPAPGGGVAVTMHLWLAFTVSKIRFEGHPPSPAKTRGGRCPAEGDPFAAALPRPGPEPSRAAC
jgi:hypothetical protein